MQNRSVRQRPKLRKKLQLERLQHKDGEELALCHEHSMPPHLIEQGEQSGVLIRVLRLRLMRDVDFSNLLGTAAFESLWHNNEDEFALCHEWGEAPHLVLSDEQRETRAMVLRFRLFDIEVRSPYIFDQSVSRVK